MVTHRIAAGLFVTFRLCQASPADCAQESTAPSTQPTANTEPSPPAADSATSTDASEPEISWESAPELRTQPDESVSGSLATESLARWNIGGNSDASYVSNRTGFHPGTRVIVEIVPSRQSRATQALPTTTRRYLAAFRNFGYWPYRICFESSARANGSSGGDTWLRVKTNGLGRVVSAKLVKSNIDLPPISDCICRATRSLDLHRPNLPGAAFMLRVRVFPGDAPLPSHVRPDDSDTGNWTLRRGAFELVRGSVEPCIRQAFTRDAKLWGRLALRLRVDKEGRVLDAAEAGTHFPDRQAVSCSTSAALQLRLPDVNRAGWLNVALRAGMLPPLVGEKVGDSREPTSSATSRTNQQ